MKRWILSVGIFLGAGAAAVYASADPRFYDVVRSNAAGLSDHFVQAGAMVAGDLHLADPTADIGLFKNDDRIEAASVVTHVEVIGGGPTQRIVLLNPQGQEVFMHDPEANTTIVAKDTIIPSVTLRDAPDAVAELRLVTAAPAIEAPAELQAALSEGASPRDLFYRGDL